MKVKRRRFFEEFAFEILSLYRIPGSIESLILKQKLKTFFDFAQINTLWEEFIAEAGHEKMAVLKTQSGEFQLLPLSKSPPCEVEGWLKKDFIKEDIALIYPWAIPEITPDLKAVILCGPFRNTYKSLNLISEVPAFNLPLSLCEKIEGEFGKIVYKPERKRVKCSNIFVEFGKGPYTTVIARIDALYGSFCASFSGFSMLMWLYLVDTLSKDYKGPRRLRFVLLDCQSDNLAGANFHVRNLPKHTIDCINLQGMSFGLPKIVYRDGAGFNSRSMIDAFESHSRDFGIEPELIALPNELPDHAPFKKQGVQTLWLNSALSISAAGYDLFDSIIWENFWTNAELLLSFLRRIHRF